MDKVFIDITRYSRAVRERMQEFTFQIKNGVSITLHAVDKRQAINRFREMNPDVVFLLK